MRNRKEEENIEESSSRRRRRRGANMGGDTEAAKMTKCVKLG